MNKDNTRKSFDDLPISFKEEVHNKEGWSKTVTRVGTVSELLKIWNIDNDIENSEFSQVLRHLRNEMYKKEQTNEILLTYDDFKILVKGDPIYINDIAISLKDVTFGTMLEIIAEALNSEY